MEKVTEIKRAHGLAAITLSDGSTLRVPSQVFLEFRLRAGDLIDRDTYEGLIAGHAYPHALDRAAKLLSSRECSEGEVAGKLRRAGYAEDVVARVLETLTRYDFVSDERFAGLYVSSRSAKYGKMRILQALRQKGVSTETARQALESVSEEEELKAASALAGKLLARRRCADADARQKVMAALVRRGYTFSTARQAVQNNLEDGNI
jgi:regulatory protein